MEDLSGCNLRDSSKLLLLNMPAGDEGGRCFFLLSLMGGICLSFVYTLCVCVCVHFLGFTDNFICLI